MTVRVANFSSLSWKTTEQYTVEYIDDNMESSFFKLISLAGHWPVMRGYIELKFGLWVADDRSFPTPPLDQKLVHK